jgi:hypothetical protein
VHMRALTAVASAKAGVRVQQPLQNCPMGSNKSKKCEKQLTHIVRVRFSGFLKDQLFFLFFIILNRHLAQSVKLTLQ